MSGCDGESGDGRGVWMRNHERKQTRDRGHHEHDRKMTCDDDDGVENDWERGKSISVVDLIIPYYISMSYSINYE